MASRDPLLPGGLVPGFELGAAIGKGGFATVYRARQISLDRDVAIKIDSRVLDDERNRRRFLREATASALISSHPHVVSLIDSGTTRDNRPYLVMELCDNGSVGQLVKRSGPMPAPDVVELGIAISSALAAAHQKGILHRDIKPSNILIDPYGTPRLGDFGLAALQTHGEASVTLEALTPAYAAPEAFEQAEPSKRADVWALGATLYSVLTGIAPRHKDDGSPQTVAEIIQSLYRPLPPAHHVQGADALLSIIWRATSPQREQRFADGTELHAALLELRGQLGRPHNVLAGAEVTRMTPGLLQQQKFPGALATPNSGSGGSGGFGGPSVRPAGFPQSPTPISGPSGPMRMAGLEQQTRPRRAWPIVLASVLAVGLVGGAAVWASTLNGQTPQAGDQGQTSQPPANSPEQPSAQGEPTPTPSPSETGQSMPPGESAGDYLVPTMPTCFGGIVSISGNVQVRSAGCDEEHAWEAYAFGSLSDATESANLEDVEQDPIVKKACTDKALSDYTAIPLDQLERHVIPPSEVEFANGSRLFYCVASGGARDQSFRR